jgi:cobalt-zinc-cadmium efflux system outer membrane protein
VLRAKIRLRTTGAEEDRLASRTNTQSRWTPRRASSVICGALLASLGGCAAVRPDASLPEVGALVAERGVGQPLLWRDTSSSEGAAAAEAASATVAELLAQPLDADAAVRIALLNNPSLQQSFQELGIAQAELVQAGLLRNPVLSAAAMPAVGAAASPKYEFDVAASLMDLLLRPSRGRIAGAQIEEAKLHSAAAVVTLAADVRAAWVAIVGARQTTRVLDGVVQAADASAAFAARLHDAGNLSDLDLTAERALAAQARAEWLRARADEIVPRERLARLLGLGGRGAFTLRDGLPPLPATDPDRDEVLALASRQRLDLAAARQEQVALREALETARAFRWFGDVQVGAAASKDSGESYFVFGPSASLELPIFDQKQAQLARLEAQLERSRLHADAVALDVASEVRAALDQLQAQRELATHLQSALVPLRERVVALSQQQYDFMQIGTFELLLAKQAEVLAYRDYVLAVRDYWLAFAALEHAAGTRLAPFPTTTSQPAADANARPLTATTNAAPAHAPDEEAMPAGHEHHHHGGR